MRIKNFILMLMALLVSTQACAKPFCIDEAGKRKLTCDAALVALYGGLFYGMGKRTAELAGGFQAGMWLIGFALPTKTNSWQEKALHHSLAAYSFYNFQKLSQYNTDDYNNVKAARFNAAAMALWAVGAIYVENQERIETKDIIIDFSPLSHDTYGISLTYQF